MAKFGEGDPRWIVEEREDAKNVNNWHWAEKNATRWSIDKITSLLSGLVIDINGFFCEILSVTKCEGEAVANNRKAKLIFFYEWQIEAEWQGHKKDGENKTNYRGKCEVTNLSEENTCDELDIVVTCESTTTDAQLVREFMRTEGTAKIRSQLGAYIKELKEEYSKGLILPTKNSTGQPTIEPLPKSSATAAIRNRPSLVSATPKPTTTPIGTAAIADLSFSEDFICTPEDLYKVFTTEPYTKTFTRGDAVVDAVPGGKYTVFGGNVTGSFVELKPTSRFVMKWRKQTWPTDHYSTVTFEFSAIDTGTRLKLSQSGVPSFDEENTRGGWISHYFNAIRQTFGFGGRIC